MSTFNPLEWVHSDSFVPRKMRYGNLSFHLPMILGNKLILLISLRSAHWSICCYQEDVRFAEFYHEKSEKSDLDECLLICSPSILAVGVRCDQHEAFQCVPLLDIDRELRKLTSFPSSPCSATLSLSLNLNTSDNDSTFHNYSTSQR